MEIGLTFDGNESVKDMYHRVCPNGSSTMFDTEEPWNDAVTNASSTVEGDKGVKVVHRYVYRSGSSIMFNSEEPQNVKKRKLPVNAREFAGNRQKTSTVMRRSE